MKKELVYDIVVVEKRNELAGFFHVNENLFFYSVIEREGNK